jgi:hypothetical protein
MHQESGGFYDLGITSVILEIRQYNNQQYDYVLYLFTYTSFLLKYTLSNMCRCYGDIKSVIFSNITEYSISGNLSVWCIYSVLIPNIMGFPRNTDGFWHSVFVLGGEKLASVSHC